jgi:hypothetical protein
MMYVVQVEQNALRASSDPLEAATALKVAKAWQSHGDRGVRIVEVESAKGKLCPSDRSWSVREFITVVRGATAARARAPESAGNTAGR